MTTEELITTTDPTKIIELNSRRHKDHGKRKTPNKGGSTQPETYKKLIKKVLSEEAATRAASLTPEEREFVDLVVSGTSFSHALLLAMPDRCIKRRKDGSPILDDEGKPEPMDLHKIYDRATKILQTVNVKAALRQSIEQEMDDVSHTSAFLRNLALKTYIREAQNAPTSSARMKAADRLRTYGEVAVRDQEQTEKAKSPEQVLADIEAQLTRLGA